MCLKKINKYACYNTRTTLAWGAVSQRSPLLPEKKARFGTETQRIIRLFWILLLTVLLGEKVSWPLPFPFNCACIMISVEPRGFLKFWLNSHANNAFLEKKVLKWLFRSCAHSCKINSVNTQLINCCVKVSDTSYGAHVFRDWDRVQHLCLHLNNILVFMKSSAYFPACFSQANRRTLLEENIKVFFSTPDFKPCIGPGGFSLAACGNLFHSWVSSQCICLWILHCSPWCNVQDGAQGNASPDIRSLVRPHKLQNYIRIVFCNQ